MVAIFNGRAFAAKKEEELNARVSRLVGNGVKPKLASILVGDDPASKLYVGLKKKKGEEIGVGVEVFSFGTNAGKDELISKIKELNSDETFGGIMIQLPLPGELQSHKDEILSTISPDKDVDGLRDDSQFLHPTSKAVVEILNEARDIVRLPLKETPLKVTVVGASGMVGKPLVKELKVEGYQVTECDTKTTNLSQKTLQADILISATGIPGIVTSEMVKPGAIVIDVGSPKGDVDSSISQIAGFMTPVPGGIGPVTITCLLENLIQKYEN